MKHFPMSKTCLLIIPMIGFAFNCFSQNKKKTFNISVFSSFGSLPTNQDAIAKTKRTASKLFPGWAVSCDKLNGLATDIYGLPVEIRGTTLLNKSQFCLSNPLSKLAIKKEEWVKVSEVSAPKADYVYYKQIIKGHEVVFTKLGFRFTKDGALSRIQIKNYGTPPLNTAPIISLSDAQKAAVANLSEITITNNEVDNIAWVWFPIPTKTGYDLHPAWHFKVTGSAHGTVPLKLTGYVDALDGKILYRTNEVKETSYDVTVKGVVYKNGMLAPTSIEPLPDLKITNGADIIYTDTSGHATDMALSLPFTSMIPLKGKWSTVIDSSTGLNPTFSDAIATPGSIYTYPTSSPSSDRHVNAYYHVNRVHNFMKNYFPAFTGMDFSLPTNIDEISFDCNAYYDGTSINFLAGDASCPSFATFGDVVYHEYGHGISDHFYTDISGTSIINGALNEACSDIWGLSITHNPILAADAFIGFGGFIRRYDMTPQVYPIDLDLSMYADPHKNGQIIAGTWWDLALNLGSVDSMTKLFTDVYFDVPDGPDGTEGLVYQTILIDALMADDNDANLLNGTPHYAQIIDAFAKHGIYLEGNATLTHTEITNQLAGAPINVSASLSLSNTTYFHDLTVYYRINDTGAWNPIVLTNTGFNFNGNIPAQPRGTIVAYYFVIHDGLNVPNAYFPITCNPNIPANQATIPYQFGVKLHATTTVDFESTPSGWGIGSNIGDDATAGQWVRNYPLGTSIGSAWPISDHTTGLGFCLQTNINYSSTYYGDQGVTNGTSTVLTPTFDLTGFINPVISYYRWFSNEQLYTNFKNDPWVVKVQDAISGTWQTVESTYQSDLNWRRRIFPLHTYLPSATKIRVKFFTSDSILTHWNYNGQSLSVGAIDDFTIYDLDTTTLSVQNEAMQNIAIYPNPAGDRLNIGLEKPLAKGDITLYDMAGNKVLQIVLDASKTDFSLNVSNIAAGQYLVIINSEKLVKSQKVIITHK